MQSHRHQKFRYGRHPSTLKAFKDDTLVAFRYESTIPAAPPIPIIPNPPPRNPLRANRSDSSVPRAVIVNPPPIPPQEQHPAFRTSPTSSSSSDDWKRDSGSGLVAVSSSTTIRDEYQEDEFLAWKKINYDEKCMFETKTVDYESSRPSFASTRPPTPQRKSEEATLLPKPETHTRYQRRGASKSFSVRSSKPPSAWATAKTTRKLQKRSFDCPRPSAADIGSAMEKSGTPPAETKSYQKGPSASGPTPHQPARAPIDTNYIRRSSSNASGRTGFSPITTTIPTNNLVDDFLSQLSFSKRGSVVLNGSKSLTAIEGIIIETPKATRQEATPSSPIRETAKTVTTAVVPRFSGLDHSTCCFTRAPKANSIDIARPAMANIQSSPLTPSPAAAKAVPSIRVMSMDAERDSDKVRRRYMSVCLCGSDCDGGDASLGERLEALEAQSDQEGEPNPYGFPLSFPSYWEFVHDADK